MSTIYEKLSKEMLELSSYGRRKLIGKSELKEPIYAYFLGEKCDNNAIIIQGGIHAREYITSFLINKIIRYLSCFYLPYQIVFIPLINPDGVRICLEGHKFIKDKSKKKLVKKILHSTNKKLYKANVNGVDLNVNFDANWGSGSQNIKQQPSSENYIGTKPNSQSEVKALIKFTKTIAPNLTLSYHSKGQVIYFGYKNQNKNLLKRQQKLLKIISKECNYKPIFTKNSAGGYKDYCLLKLNILGYTIEVGNDELSHPIKLKELNNIFRENKDIILKILKEEKYGKQFYVGGN